MKPFLSGVVQREESCSRLLSLPLRWFAIYMHLRYVVSTFPLYKTMTIFLVHVDIENSICCIFYFLRFVFTIVDIFMVFFPLIIMLTCVLLTSRWARKSPFVVSTIYQFVCRFQTFSLGFVYHFEKISIIDYLIIILLLLLIFYSPSSSSTSNNLTVSITLYIAKHLV